MWKLYDELIEGIPAGILTDDITVGLSWTAVTAGQYRGAAMTVKEQERCGCTDILDSRRGQPLKYLASLSKSWNFIEASIGVAAINAYYNNKETWERSGLPENPPWQIVESEDAFEAYANAVEGKKAAVIGHFRQLEEYLAGAKSLSILERRPTADDYPDSACEYILPEQEYVFITGSALINKTLPRLLALSKAAHVILVGPSTPMTPILFAHGVDELSGFMAGSKDNLIDAASIAGHRAFFASGERIRMLKQGA
ncbi:MAG: DUF364 domain-containing protein [Eubacteriales bacterium]|nr:DUF364 domain-containing protein [Eubacteriales bacterium]